MTPPFVPERGDTIWLDLQPTVGHEQSGRRPVLVMTPREYNGLTGLAVVCPLSNQQKGYGFEVPLPVGLGVTGVVLVDQLKCVDWRHRNVRFLTKVPRDFVDRVARRVARLLQVPQRA
ncbi:MAG TPA: type II toxin-antitoxin system PemK/MazF family toxin [Thermoanaerobaculia bacterium]|nr:type II toxin-antitoxin system PemK/MazF family toxin [Thermoanaerobaculia bacterium]